MKKLVSSKWRILFLVVVMYALVEIIVAFLYNEPYSYVVYKDEQYAAITKYNGKSTGKIKVPEELGGYPVKRIRGRAFEDIDANMIELPETVEYLEECAFCKCNVNEIAGIENVKYIGEMAFWGCNFEEFRIPDAVSEIDEYTFNSCFSLKKVIVPKSVLYIHKYAFYSCGELEEICFEGEPKRVDDEFIVMGNSVDRKLSEVTVKTTQGSIIDDKAQELGAMVEYK